MKEENAEAIKSRKIIGIAVLLISILLVGCGQKETKTDFIQETEVHGRDSRVNHRAQIQQESTETIENAGQYAQLERLLQDLKSATD